MIMMVGGNSYTLGVQANRPFRQGSKRPSYPALPIAPLQVIHPIKLSTGAPDNTINWRSR